MSGIEPTGRRSRCICWYWPSVSPAWPEFRVRDPGHPAERRTGSRAGERKERRKKGRQERREKGLPLKSDRKVSFTTDEARGLSLDVSPDGKTIAFELLGDIYTLRSKAERQN